MEGRPRGGALLLAALTAVLTWQPALAMEIPFSLLFWGAEPRSIIDDATHYPRSYASFETHLWDIYHERRGGSHHDYETNAQSFLVVRRPGRALVGVRFTREHLSLINDNVYTDADHLGGHRIHTGGSALLGYSRDGDFPLGVTRLDAVAGAGSNGDFLGEVEARLTWGDAAALLFQAETFASELETEQTVRGATFPFHFPYRTERVAGRVEATPIGSVRLRATGTYARNAGSGAVVDGFENRLWFRRVGISGTFDYALEPQHRLHVLPRLDGTGPLGARVRLSHVDGDGRLGMHFDGTRYALLDGLETANTIATLDVALPAGLALHGGWEHIALRHRGDSFADVWPFTIWDLFQAKRYRLDDLDARLDTWFAGLGVRHESNRWLGELRGRFESWDEDVRLDWLERIDIFFPFFFRFDRHHEEPTIDARYAAQLDAAFWWHLGPSASVRLSGRATVPFGSRDEGDGGPPPAPGPPPPSPAPAPPEDRTHGGLVGTLELFVGLGD